MEEMPKDNLENMYPFVTPPSQPYIMARIEAAKGRRTRDRGRNCESESQPQWSEAICSKGKEKVGTCSRPPMIDIPELSYVGEAWAQQELVGEGTSDMEPKVVVFSDPPTPLLEL